VAGGQRDMRRNYSLLLDASARILYDSYF